MRRLVVAGMIVAFLVPALVTHELLPFGGEPIVVAPIPMLDPVAVTGEFCPPTAFC